MVYASKEADRYGLVPEKDPDVKDAIATQAQIAEYRKKVERGHRQLQQYLQVDLTTRDRLLVKLDRFVSPIFRRSISPSPLAILEHVTREDYNSLVQDLAQHTQSAQEQIEKHQALLGWLEQVNQGEARPGEIADRLREKVEDEFGLAKLPAAVESLITELRAKLPEEAGKARDARTLETLNWLLAFTGPALEAAKRGISQTADARDDVARLHLAITTIRPLVDSGYTMNVDTIDAARHGTQVSATLKVQLQQHFDHLEVAADALKLLYDLETRTSRGFIETLGDRTKALSEKTQRLSSLAPPPAKPHGEPT